MKALSFFFSLLVVFTLAPARASQGGPVSKELAPYVSVDAPTIAIVHVRVIDGTGKPAQNDQTVVFSGGRITAVGPAASVTVPSGAKTIDGAGKTLLPGYVGTHSHLFTGTGNPVHMWRSMPYSFPRLYLAAGTTTIRTTGSMDIYRDLSVKHDVDAGLEPGPHIDITSPYLTGPGNQDPQMQILRDAADARQTVDFWADHGVTSFKVYTNITHDALAAVIDEAHKRGLKVMGHLCSIGFEEAAALGIDELEHGPYFTDTEFVAGKQPDHCPSTADEDLAADSLPVDGAKMRALIADLVAHKVPVSSTLPVFESFIPARAPSSVDKTTLDLLDSEQRAYVLATRARIDSAAANGPGFTHDHPGIYQRLMQKEMAFELAFYRAGGLLDTGCDPSGYGAVIAGTGDWRDAELLVQGGFSPVEAIHVATQDGAVALGLEKSIGSTGVGLNADVVLVGGDPSTNIDDVEHVETVFKDGVGYDSKKLLDSVKGVVGRM